MAKRKWELCGAQTRRGTKCQCKRIPGKKRCKFHGGLSTGPKTPKGKRQSAKNLEKANAVRQAMPAEWHAENARKAADTRARNALAKETQRILLEMRALGIRVRFR